MEAARVVKKRHNGDRISSLLNDVLCHILSFLPTIYSVRTRVLSSRWTYLFTYVPALDFDLGTSNEENGCIPSINFVNKVFMMYAVSQMSKFRLHDSYSLLVKIENLSFWISSAICHNVQELDICVYGCFFQALPDDIFCSRVLSIIKLEGYFVVELPPSACLPSLKIFYIRRVFFSSSVKWIFSVFPMLEDLLLYKYVSQYSDVYDVSHPNLKKLWVEDSHHGHNLVLNFPSLLYFDYLSSGTINIIGKSVSTSLVKARICPQSETPSVDCLSQLFSVVSHARLLYLSRASVEAFENDSDKLPTFTMLTRLEVGEVSKVVLGLLPDLFIRSRHLKVLIFDKGFTDEGPDDTDLPLCYKDVPACVSSHLKEIEFRVFSMQENECELVKYFLKNAKVLDKIKIQSSMGWKKQFEFSKKLLTFPKFSMNCQIILDSDCAAGE